MRTAWLVGAVAVALSVAAFGFERSQSARAERDSQVSMVAELRGLRSEMQDMQAKLSAFEQGRREQGAAKPPGVVVPPEIMARLTAVAEQSAAATGPQPGSAPPPTAAQEREQTLEYARFLDDQLARFSASDDPATPLAAKISKYFDKSSVLLDLRCGKDLCRVQTRHVDLVAYHAFQTNAFTHDERLWSGPTTFVVLDEGDDSGRPVLAAIYLSRGSAMPSSAPTL
ncbi:MAG TPA: hypothetical protein VK524_08625 [Polyangiaceae bacterium]|nr:hypothetical protein [Polyangiaceae bacterium]